MKSPSNWTQQKRIYGLAMALINNNMHGKKSWRDMLKVEAMCATIYAKEPHTGETHRRTPDEVAAIFADMRANRVADGLPI
jgi:hypothetical protein